MRKWIISFSMLMASFAFAGQIASVNKPENIQVLLAKEATEALLEVRGSYNIHDPKDGAKIGSGLLGKRFLVHPVQNGLRWGETFPGVHQLYISPRSEKTTILLNGIEYKGAMGIYKVGQKLYVVNDLAIEDYVKSVLTPQFPYPLDSEVMASVAILARTDAYFLASKYRDAMWQIDSDEVKYQGSALILDDSAVDRAVDLTKHLVLVLPKQGQKLTFPAKWTEHSAGITASYSTIFRKDGVPILDTVKAPHASLDREESKWSYTVSKGELASKLGVKEITKIDLYFDTASSKTYGIRVKGKEQTKDFDFFDFQETLGKFDIQSNEFQVTIVGEEVQFKGYGKGHGVGLCLYSAASMAQNGENAVQILSKFFPKTHLVNLNAIPAHQRHIADNK